MKYSFSAQIDAPDGKYVKITFDSDNARDLRGAWQGINGLLNDLSRVDIIYEHTLTADKKTEEAWEREGLI